MVEKISCPNCNASIYANFGFCPKCGTKILINEFHKENLGNLYKLLQVDPAAEQEVIEAAYKRLAAKYHPDVNKSPDAQSQMQDINRAYQILSKAETRRQYDMSLEAQPDEVGKQSTERTIKPETDEEFYQRKEKEYERYREKQKEGERIRKELGRKNKQPNKTGSSSVGEKLNRNKRQWIWVAIFVAILFMAVVCVSGFAASLTFLRPTPTPTRTSRPVATSTARPTPTPFIAPTVADYNPDCVFWEKIDNKKVGEKICGYGFVIDVYSAAEYIQIISFSELPGTFIIKGEDYYFEDVIPGDCVWFEGKLYNSSYSLYLNIDDDDIELGIIDENDIEYQYCLLER